MSNEKRPLYVWAKGAFLGDEDEARSFLRYCENSFYDSAEEVSSEEFKKLKKKFESLS